MAADLFYFLVFPGLLFAGIAGGFLSWFDRKGDCQGSVPQRAATFTAFL